MTAIDIWEFFCLALKVMPGSYDIDMSNNFNVRCLSNENFFELLVWNVLRSYINSYVDGQICAMNDEGILVVF